MGRTLKEFRNQKKQEMGAQGLRRLVEKFPSDPPIKSQGHITIDLHGEGYREWLERHGGQEASDDCGRAINCARRADESNDAAVPILRLYAHRATT